MTDDKISMAGGVFNVVLAKLVGCIASRVVDGV
jgi:hypothetical protein